MESRVDSGEMGTRGSGGVDRKVDIGVSSVDRNGVERGEDKHCRTREWKDGQ